MQADSCPEAVLQPILDRIHLETLGSPQFYRQEAHRQGWVELGFEELTHQLTHQVIRHYRRVLEETEARQDQLQEKISATYLENMKKGLRY